MLQYHTDEGLASKDATTESAPGLLWKKHSVYESCHDLELVMTPELNKVEKLCTKAKL